MEPAVSSNATPQDHFQGQANATSPAEDHHDSLSNMSESSPGNTISKTCEDHHGEPLQQEQHVTVPTMKQGQEGNTPAETHLLSSQQTLPVPAAEQGQENMANSNSRADSAAVLGEAGGSNPAKNLGSSLPSFPQSSGSSSRDLINVAESTDTNVIQKRESCSEFGAESSEDDISICSMPKHGEGRGQNSAAALTETNNGSEIQNPPTQVMERPEDSDSAYRIPSHVFATDKTNTVTEWSTCSSESLFSIHMGNMSFSKDLTWLKSGGFSNPGETNMSDQFDAVPSSPAPASPSPTPVANLTSVNKLNDIGPKTDSHYESPGATEAKAAETMREVIRENTQKVGPRDLSFRLSHQSEDGSTKSFVFPILAGDGNKSHSLRGVEEKPNQQTPKEIPMQDLVLASIL
ncbi:hypothetical protein L6164_011251 [Bauhinia variegata]|uniref:Uncharacterized protein n=1 Tax=Bauhinia variegata TaxID=167791 RepID=A0ACB9P683_BAUVA|nr:hypothetical protein L6164_011251 [Bauhinia variegata]